MANKNVRETVMAVNIEIKGNKTFYFPGKPVNYTVTIDDKDDTAKVVKHTIIKAINSRFIFMILFS